MLGKVISAYWKQLQEDIFAPYSIRFDPLYTSQMEDFRQAMSNYSLRQMYDFDKLASARITPDMLERLNQPQEGGYSYNYVLYQYSPLKRDSMRANNCLFDIIYTHNPATDNYTIKVKDSATGRTFEEVGKDEQLYAISVFEEQEKESPNSPMQNGITEAVVGNITPKVEITPDTPTTIQRQGFFGEFDLTCRFCTTNTTIFEDFLILYNAVLLRNPASYIKFKSVAGGESKLAIRTKYSEISQAQLLDPDKHGNLLIIEWTVTLSTMFLSNYHKTHQPINSVGVYTEVQNNLK